MPVEIKNGITYVEKSLSKQMGEWKEQGENVGILLVDESNTEEADETVMTLDQYHNYQRMILDLANHYEFPIFITEIPGSWGAHRAVHTARRPPKRP